MFQHWLETVNLSPIFTMACIAGVLTTVFVMQSTWMESEHREHNLLRWFRRGSQFALAASLLWALNYSIETSWQPWPPLLAIVLSADLMMLGRAFSIRSKIAEQDTAQIFQSKILGFFLFGIVIAAMILAGMAFDRASPYASVTGVVMPANPKPGDTIQIHWTGGSIGGGKARDCPGTIHRLIEDSEQIQYGLDRADSIYAMIKPGHDVVRVVQLPSRMACGPAFYLSRGEFYCNPLQRIWPIQAVGKPVSFNVTCP